MIRYVFNKMLVAFKHRYNYDVHYQQDILKADLGAFLMFMGFQTMSSYTGKLSAGPVYAARIRAALWDDCGPCAQLVVNMALEAKVSPDIINSIIRRELDNLPEEIALVMRFTELVLAHDPGADELREKIRTLWGEQGLIALAYSISSCRVYPTLKYALGYGKACQQIKVNGLSLVPY